MIVAHLDMDAFFAACEERANPQFAGLGIVVGADPKNGLGRGVVSTANYQARKYGIHSAMPISQAFRLAQNAAMRGEPNTVFLPVNAAYYSRVSDKIFEIVHRYVRIVEQTSIDEAYLDLGKTIQDRFYANSILDRDPFDDAVDLIQKIKAEIKSQEKLTAKVGIGPNKLIAKMASASCLPDGLKVVGPDEVERFLDPLPIGDIPGVGPKSEEFFHKKKIYKISDLKKISLEQLRSWIGPPATLRVAMRAGKWGEDIWEKARGIDDSPVTVEREIKSISEQETFEKDTASAAFILERLDKLAGRVIDRMKDDGISAFKTVTIVVRFADFTTRNRTHTLKNYTDNLTVFKNESIKMMLPFFDHRENPKKKLVRLIGVGIESFPGEESNDSDKEKKKIIEQTSLL